ncbi:BspA family leucine-rich repeat surface protein [Leuconostoc falkenbergense]|uniref:BspA family leucine-rich repeat surface protein n=1 Tax=Leuconostoc falkenbergense TaxID=2766470 RepID=UPI003F94F693
MKKYVRKAILLTITLLLVGASPIQMVAAVAAEQSNLKSATHDKTKTAALLNKVFKMPKRQSEVNASAHNDKAEAQPEPKIDPVPEPDEPDVAQKEKISEPTLAPQLKATEPITGTYGTSPWTLDPDTGVLEFGAGFLDNNTSIRDDSVLSSYVSQIKEIKFLAGAKLPASANHMFWQLTSLEKFDSANLDTSNTGYMAYMFYGSKAETLDLSSFDTSGVTTMYAMFADSNVTTLDLSNFDTSAVTDMSYMFSDSKTAALNLSNFNTSAVTDMSYMFSGSKATALNLSSFSTSSVTNMSCMFYDSRVTTLDLSNFNTSAVTKMIGMFASSEATALNLSSFNTSSVTDMLLMFAGSEATALDLSSFNTSSVINMSYMFYESRATTLDLSSFNTSAVTDMSYMFSNSEAKTLNFSNFNTSAVNGMSYMFYQARVLTLDLSAFTFKSGCDVSYMLYVYNGNLWKLTLGAGQTFSGDPNIMDPSRGSTIPGAGSDYVSGGRWQVVGDGTDHAPTGAKISGADIPSDSRAVKTTYVWEHVEKWRGVNGNSPWYLNPDDGVLTFYKSEDGSPTVLAEQIYDNLSNQFGWANELYKLVTAIRFEDDVAAPVNASSLFYGLENVQSIDCTNLDTSNVEDMSSMFADLYSLTTLNIDGFITDKVEDMASMFLSTPNLTTLDLSSFDTSNVKNMFAMFALNGVKHLNLSHFNTDKVENMQVMFLASLVETLDISSFDLSGLKDVDPDDGIGLTSPVALMFIAMSTLDPESEQGSNLWQVKLGEQTVFPDDPGFEAAPAAGTTIPGTSYVTTAASWQAVCTGTEFNPQGAMVTTAEMYADRTEPVTYVWANKAEPPTIDSVSNLTFGTLGASDFFNGNSPLATNMSTGSVALKDLDNSTTYNVTVAQTSDWATDGESATIARSNLKIKYGANDLSTGASSFWSGTSATATKSIPFNHMAQTNFSIWLNPNAVLSTNLLGKQLESELTWTLSETPE